MVFGFSFLTSELFFKTLLIHFHGISSILKSKNLFMISDVQLRAPCHLWFFFDMCIALLLPTSNFISYFVVSSFLSFWNWSASPLVFTILSNIVSSKTQQPGCLPTLLLSWKLWKFESFVTELEDLPSTLLWKYTGSLCFQK